MFNLLAARRDFDGLHVLDLYAGSGALGLEALSRVLGPDDLRAALDFLVSRGLAEPTDSIREAMVVAGEPHRHQQGCAACNELPTKRCCPCRGCAG